MISTRISMVNIIKPFKLNYLYLYKCKFEYFSYPLVNHIFSKPKIYCIQYHSYIYIKHVVLIINFIYRYIIKDEYYITSGRC